MTTVEAIKHKKDLLKIEKLLQKENYRDFLLFCFGINTGLRISDILKLDIKDVKNKNFVQIKEKKTGKFKKFPLNSKLKQLIEFYTNNKELDEPLFKTKYGNRLDRIMAYKIIKKACNTINPDITVGTHTLRKTFGYHYFKQFKNIVMLQKIFNHSSQEITLRYIGIEQDDIYNSYLSFIL